MSKDIDIINVPEDFHKDILDDICFKPHFSGLLFPFLTHTTHPALEKTVGASFIVGFLIVIVVIAFFIKLTRKTEYVRFPPGSNQVLHGGIYYKIDPYSDMVEITQKLNFKYSPRGKEKAINLVNGLGAEEVQKRAGLFSKLIFIFMILFFLLAFFPWKFGDIRFAGLIVTAVIGIVSFYLSVNYDSAMEYYKDSYCKNCGRYFVLEEFQAPLMKDESRNDTYEKTRTGYWRCKNCGYKDIKVESQHVSHYYGKKPKKSKSHKCKHCGRASAIEEYRSADIIRDPYSESKRRYYRCRYCDYHEIKINEEIYAD